MKRKNLIFSLIFSLIVILLAIIYYFEAPYFKTLVCNKTWLETNISNQEQLLLNFINNNLTNDQGGIYTNYVDENSEGDITKGHAILSESEGIMLLYSVEKNDKVSFDKTLDYINKNMILSNNTISWRIENKVKYNTSSTIDDLRIIKALLFAEKRWDDKKYRKVALKISKGIYKELVDKGTLVDFNNENIMSDTTTLCYLDIQTLNMLSSLNSSWNDVLNKSVKIIENGYISDELPLYRKEFNRKEQTYDKNDIDMLLSMIVILNKQDGGYDISKSLDWIKDKFKNEGFITTLYSNEGKSISNIESTSIYSFILQMASKSGDKELVELAMNKIHGFQVNNEKSKIYGGYGSEDATQVYSYDNLNALMAYRYFIY